jgi:hypothetical protein
LADRFYGAAVGANLPQDVTEAATTTSAAVELRISDTAYSDRRAVIIALRAIERYLEAVEKTPIS